MAYKDSSGKITIDEIAAKRDIQRIEKAVVSLENARKALENVVSQASSEKGAVSDATVEKTSELIRQIDDMLRRLRETSGFISKTVCRYYLIDKELRDLFNSSHHFG